MGTWGTGIYSNDTASDVRDACQEIFPFLSVDEGNEILFNEFEQELSTIPTDNDEASFWYALADWQWKHGMLKEEIRQKTISLLEQYVGIEEWKNDASSSDVKKRKKVLDALREKLSKDQPPCKPPKAKLRKPWHKPGDIWIFKTPDEHQNVWNTKGPNFFRTFYKKNRQICDAGIDAVNNDWLFDLRGKYLAVLCVETILELHSKYVPDVYDEDSVYAVYDFRGDSKPTLRDLNSCGFLASIAIEDLELNSHGKHTVDPYLHRYAWYYKFAGYGAYLKRDYFDSEVLHIDSESERFWQLAKIHNIESGANTCIILHQGLFYFHLSGEAYRRLGLKFNTLVDPYLPPLPCPTPEEGKYLFEKYLAAEKQYRIRHGMRVF